MLPPIYHLHIPRTSGTNILYSVQRANALAINNQSGKERLKIYDTGMFEFIFDKHKAESCNFISGHFAVNPIVDLEIQATFCLVRNPIEQFISSSAYRCMSNRKEFTSEELDRYLGGAYDRLGAFHGFSGAPNPQSHFLYSEIIKIDSDKFYENAVAFAVSPKSIEEIKPYINEMNIFTMENRATMIAEMNLLFLDRFGIKIEENKNKVNSTRLINFQPTKEQIRKIEEKVWLDIEVYEHVKAREKSDVRQ